MKLFLSARSCHELNEGEITFNVKVDLAKRLISAIAYKIILSNNKLLEIGYVD